MDGKCKGENSASVFDIFKSYALDLTRYKNLGDGPIFLSFAAVMYLYWTKANFEENLSLSHKDASNNFAPTDWVSKLRFKKLQSWMWYRN